MNHKTSTKNETVRARLMNRSNILCAFEHENDVISRQILEYCKNIFFFAKGFVPLKTFSFSESTS